MPRARRRPRSDLAGNDEAVVACLSGSFVVKNTGQLPVRRYRLRSRRGRRTDLHAQVTRQNAVRQSGSRWPVRTRDSAMPRPSIQTASANPASELQNKVATRLALDSQTQVSLPSDPTLAARRHLEQTKPRRSHATGRQRANPPDRGGHCIPRANRNLTEHPVRRRWLPGLPVDVRDRPGVHDVCIARRRAVRYCRGWAALTCRR